MILALAVFSFSAFHANAQVDVTINPIGLLFGDLSIGGDFILSDEFSVEATIGIGGGNDDFTSLKWSNIPIGVVGKYYFNPDDGADNPGADPGTPGGCGRPEVPRCGAAGRRPHRPR